MQHIIQRTEETHCGRVKVINLDDKVGVDLDGGTGHAGHFAKAPAGMELLVHSHVCLISPTVCGHSVVASTMKIIVIAVEGV